MFIEKKKKAISKLFLMLGLFVFKIKTNTTSQIMSNPPSLKINRNTNYTVVSKNLDATERDSVIRKTTIHTINLYNKDRHIQSSKCLIISSKNLFQRSDICLNS